MEGEMTIGRVARDAGVGVEAIRFYQRQGLLPLPRKPLGGQRRYAGEFARRVGFIKRAQQLGFTLDEVKSLLLLEDGTDCGETRRLAERKLAVIKERLRDLRRMDRMLTGLIQDCRRGKRPRSCPIIETLENGAGRRMSSVDAAGRTRRVPRTSRAAAP